LSSLVGTFSPRWTREETVLLRNVLRAAASVVILGQVQPADAQQTDQSVTAGNSGLEEVVVTARRREEKIQTVPESISAFSQKDLEEKHIEQVYDLVHEVPSLGMSLAESDPNAPFSEQVNLRGLEGVVTYFAGVPVGKADEVSATGLAHGLSAGNFFDLDHVEVDKGPQGTLFGKNSIGGLISFEPKHPTEDFEGYGKVTVGNYDDHEFEGAVNVPVVPDILLIRVAGESQQRDGYTIDARNGIDYDNRDYYSWRVGVTFRPTDDFENYLLYTGYWQHTNGDAAILVDANPQFPLLAKYPIAAILAQQQALGVRTVVGQPGPAIGKDYFYGITDTARWDIDEAITIQNIASAQITKTLGTANTGGTYLPITFTGNLVNNQGWQDNSVQYTDEVQIQGKSLNDKLSWVLGGYLEFDHPLGYNQFDTVSLGSTSYYHFYNSARSQAVFAHGIYDLSDWLEGLKFSAGYRYTWDFVSNVQLNTANVDAILRSPTGLPTNCGSINASVNCVNAASGNFNSPGWNLSLDEQLNDATLVYVRSGNAYRPGGFNLITPPQYQKYQPEHVTDVEIGIKSDWDFMGMHARTNFDLFHSTYKDIQLKTPVTFVDATGVLRVSQAFSNGGGATIEGGEFQGTFVPVKGLEVSPELAYVYARYDVYPNAPVAGLLPPFLYFPKVQYGVSATYHLPIDTALGDVSVGLDYYWNGQQYDSVAAAEKLNIIPSHDQLNVRVDWNNIMGRPFDAEFFMTNATNNTYITGVNGLWTQLGYDTASFSEPRMFGFSLKYRFGPGLDSGI
jgi:iron complex outermembrane recepter protein